MTKNIKHKLIMKLKTIEMKLISQYRQNALPLAYRYAKHAKHTNMHTDTHMRHPYELPAI
jgi:hypothetical protein